MSITKEELIQAIQQLPLSDQNYVIESILESRPVEPEISTVISNPALLGGEPVIQGTKTPVRAIVELWRLGTLPEEIPQHLPHLTLAQVFGALSYYVEHQAEINHYIEINRVPEQ